MQLISRFRLRSTIVVALVLALILALVFAITLSLHTTTHATGASTNSTHRYGPFHSTNDPDGGTCGNIWATDTFDRIFLVNSQNPLTFKELFTNGQFVTNAGPSSNACANGPNNGNTVAAGITGKIYGTYGNVTVTGGTYNPSAMCTATTCNTTTGFCTTVYGPTAVCTVNSYNFNYTTTDNGGCTQDSSDQGGYYGDITGSAAPATPVKIIRKHIL